MLRTEHVVWLTVENAAGTNCRKDAVIWATPADRSFAVL
jgi:hypothetical protein